LRLIRDIQPKSDQKLATALAVGNFDGLHRGHQALIRAVCARADELTPALMCFEPLPATFFRPDHPVPRVLNVRNKLDLCRGYGIDRVFMLRFSRRFAEQSADAFAANMLAGLAGARHVVVGPDFRFGAKAAGDVELLAELGKDLGFTVQVVGAVMDQGEKVSSSLVRAAMKVGDLDRVRHLLGRSCAMSGRVLRGRQLGARLGYPTVNLRPPVPPALRGVFAVRVSGAGLERHAAVASLGNRPTVAGKDWLLEAHLFDYQGDLYGKHLTVEFIQYLRPEQKYDDLETMKAQMDTDAQKARSILNPEP
jgi:riboflavin kinase/FMN adenylyltransferase